MVRGRGADARRRVVPRDAAQPAAVAAGAATITSRRLSRPLPLNTVALLKAASERLRIGAGDAMHYAERLYLSGLTSYPPHGDEQARPRL